MVILGKNSTTIRVIMSRLNSWLNDVESIAIQELAPEASDYLKEAVKEQDTIGWEHWFCGRICIKWGELYNEDIKTPRLLCKHQ
jgi:hypothetical protein